VYKRQGWVGARRVKNVDKKIKYIEDGEVVQMFYGIRKKVKIGFDIMVSTFFINSGTF